MPAFSRLLKLTLPLATATGAIASTTSLVILYNKNFGNQDDLDKELQDFEKPSEDFEEKTEFLKAKEKAPVKEEKKEDAKKEKEKPTLAEVLLKIPLVLANLGLAFSIDSLKKLKETEIPEEIKALDFDISDLDKLPEGFDLEKALQEYKDKQRDALAEGEQDLEGTAAFTAAETLTQLVDLKKNLASLKVDLAGRYSIT